jgi:hypothetical protein
LAKRDWRTNCERAEVIVHDVWYRSPLWDKDHHLGRPDEFVAEGIAWCGRPLQVAMEGWGDPKLEGLYITNRRAAGCAECERREREWHAAVKART